MKLNNPITQEPWAEQFDLENRMQEWVTDSQSEKEIKAFISKWLKQERLEGYKEGMKNAAKIADKFFNN